MPYIDSDYQRPPIRTDVEAEKFWHEVFHSISRNLVNPSHIYDLFQLGDPELVKATKEDSGVYMELKRLGLQLFRIREVATAMCVGAALSKSQEPLKELARPEMYVHNSAVAVHFIQRKAEQAKVADKVGMDRYVELSKTQMPRVLLREKPAQLYGVAEGFSAVQNRLVSVDLVRFKGK